MPLKIFIIIFFSFFGTPYLKIAASTLQKVVEPSTTIQPLNDKKIVFMETCIWLKSWVLENVLNETLTETQLNYYHAGRNCRTIWIVWNALILSKGVIIIVGIIYIIIIMFIIALLKYTTLLLQTVS